MIAACLVTIAACSSTGAQDPGAGSTTGALAAGSSGADGKPTDPGYGGGAADGKPGCGPTPAPPPDKCEVVDAGSACTDPDAKALIEKLCEGLGATSAGISFEGKQCLATCCPVPTPPPPPTPTDSCTWTVIGDGKSCVSYPDIKTQALAICAAQKAEPQTIASADDCTGGATITKLECCVSAPATDPSKDPPPPPPKK